MPGIYIHIPFCKQACNYCNFHFTTSTTYKNDFLAALLKEIELQKDYLANEKIETIYFGGGTPSLLRPEEILSILGKIRGSFSIDDNAEITMEANPDDINETKLSGWGLAGINRLSIGIQSFFDEDLKWMNRSHNAAQAKKSIELAQKKGFNNITIDLIYGAPLLTDEKWEQNVRTALQFKIPHLSCYALTIEPKTPLQKMIREHKKVDIDPDKQAAQFLTLMEWLSAAGFEHYEISNFAKPGFRSRHNSSYWQGKKYLGLGPSAHSFNGTERQWNISNNKKYIDSVNSGVIPFEKEELSSSQKQNEYIMTSLRTLEGMSLEKLNRETIASILEKSKKYIERELMFSEENFLKLTRKGRLLADGIAADLFSD